ncbi:MAG: PD40 domain-containing protein [Bryobacterales bacterium]|nr:PD40 domain-containing protein [Bryobacterales bacterium]
MSNPGLIDTRKAARLALLLLCAGAATASGQPALFQQPALSRTHIVFHHGGDLWTVGREGGMAHRLTTAPGQETEPVFSPDGQWIAFTGEYDGNVDVFLVPAAGGVPRRLTYHPAADTAVGWTRDGKCVLFRSNRNSYSRFSRLFTIAVDGVFPEELPLHQAEYASFSPDGTQIAYLPLAPAFRSWKRYRGGRTTSIWVARLSDSAVVDRIPRDNSNDFAPMWVDGRIYFLSDRTGPFTLFSYDTKTKKVSQALPAGGFDLKWASAGPDAIVYEQFGSLFLFDLKTGKPRKVPIALSGDLPEVRPRLERTGDRITAAAISATGARAVFEARGEIFTVPAEKGDARNITNTPGAAERDPAWSPDGKWIAYFSDETGEYLLHVAGQTGSGEVRRFRLGNPASFYYSPTWSPDSSKIAYTDKAMNVAYLDLASGQAVQVDCDRYDGPRRVREVRWSPDSRWLTYTRQLRSTLRAVFVYSLDNREKFQITDGMSDAIEPVFDRDGKYLYFLASTDTGLNVGWRDMSSYFRPQTSSVYAAVLRRDLPSPLLPESDEEKSSEAAKEKTDEKKPLEVKIDTAEIEQRIVALPVPARDYRALRAGKTGVLYIAESPAGAAREGPGGAVIHKFDLKTRKTERLLDGAAFFDVSANGEKMLFRRGNAWTIAGAGAPPKAGEGALKTNTLEARVDPRAEWRQMYREAWRIQRDFFYDPNLHGLDLPRMMTRYEPFLEAVSSRSDLNYLFSEMMGEFTCSHLSVGGGSAPEVKRVNVGLLGADYRVENGRYRFARVYSGESWNPDLRAPLTQPGVNVTAGEYLLAVNGKDLPAAANVYSYFEGTAGKQVVLRVGPNADASGSREVTVIPLDSEMRLRNLAWIEGNRRKVDQLSGGRLAYVYLPDTAMGGYVNFNRYYFAQIGKEGAVIDERFNGGGSQPDYILDYLRRGLMHYRTMREGEDITGPLAGIFGPKAMLINEYAGSGGDTMPWYFRTAGVGPLIGKRTWGGLVGGLGGAPRLMDGGFVSPPSVGFWDPARNEWVAENTGIPPDIEVEQDPKAVREGKDPQLERAVEVLLAELKRNPPPKHSRPPFPNYHRKAAAR